MKIFFPIFLCLFTLQGHCNTSDQNMIEMNANRIEMVINLFKSNYEGKPKPLPDWAGKITFEVIGFTSGKHVILPNENETLCNVRIQKKVDSNKKSLVTLRFTITPSLSIKGGKREQVNLGQILTSHTVTQVLFVESEILNNKKVTEELLLLMRK
jgi:hypothetical protein